VDHCRLQKIDRREDKYLYIPITNTIYKLS
jgi:hypothetical protein